MPPWEAVKGFGEFRDDRGLTQEELETISSWVEGGAPEGEPKYLPSLPKLVSWQDPAAPKGTSEMILADGASTASSSKVVAIRAQKLKAARACRSSRCVRTPPSSLCCGSISTIRYFTGRIITFTHSAARWNKDRDESAASGNGRIVCKANGNRKKH